MKKLFLVIVIIAFASGNIFAYEDYETDSAKNTITFDLVPLIFYTPIFWIVDPALNFVGTSIQYERYISRKFSVAGKIYYRGFYIIDDWQGEKTLDLFSVLSLDAIARYYPTGKQFFLDGILGYASLLHSYEGYGTTRKSNSHFFKLGAKLGWRIDFGKPRGFVLEPSFGYYASIGRYNIETGEGWFSDLAAMLQSFVVNQLLIGSGYFSLCMGWSF